ncbi:MAG: hypothetical protein F4Y86_06140 [Gammaproteobacteria bacterium]|nr:hypothetical protein [Gammaproteobacteria bacterium]
MADYVELLALKGKLVQRASVADFLADNDWDFDLILSPEAASLSTMNQKTLSQRIDGADELASVVYRQLEERQHVLRGRYPFILEDEHVKLDPAVDPKANAYVAVLAMTVAHAYGVPSGCAPARLFEQTVTDVLCERGIAAVGFAAVRRTHGSFEKALPIACDAVGLIGNVEGVPVLKWAHDEKVDVLGHVGWEDGLRFGSWGFLGQVTVGRSDSWETKIKEPNRDHWKQFTGTGVSPARFLAVPHHVERQMLERLTGDDTGIVLDRLRLVRYKAGVSENEERVVEAVLGEYVEPLSG